MFLDEPFTAVDSRTTQELMTLIKQWHKSGKTIIAVLHDIPIVKEYFPKSLMLARKVYGYGATDAVLTQENMNAMAFQALNASQDIGHTNV
jgi:zinc/manganese transport system ATP-binding protein